MTSTHPLHSDLLTTPTQKPRILTLQLRTPDGKIYDPDVTVQQRAFHESPAIYRAAIGGQRSGKTTAAFMEVLKWATTPEYLPNEHDPRPLKILITRYTFGELQRITWPHLLSVVPKELIIHETSSPQNMELHLSTGVIFVGMNLQDYNRMGGFEVGGFLIDEVQEITDPQVFHHLRSRLTFSRGPNKGILCGYPCGENWYYHLFFNGEQRRANYQGFIFRLDDNKAISAAKRREIREGYTAEEAARWCDGSFNTFEDAIFPMFKRFYPDKETPQHVIPRFKIPDHYPIYAAIDPGWDHPAAMIIFRTDEAGNVYITGEVYLKKTDEATLCGLLADKLDDKKPEFVVLDPFDNKRVKDTSGEPIKEVDIWRKHLKGVGITNLIVGKRAPTKANITLIRDYLRVQEYRKHPLNPQINNAPQLYVFSDCTNTIYEFEHWRYNSRGEPQDTGDDAISCVYNFLQMRPRSAPVSVVIQKKLPKVFRFSEDDERPVPSYLYDDVLGNQYALKE